MSLRTGLLAKLILSIVFGILSIVNVVITVLLVSTARGMVQPATSAHASNSDGIIGIYGLLVGSIASVPAILALVFGGLCVFFGRQWRRF